VSIRNDLAEHIRRVDGDNTLPAHELGYEIAHQLTTRPRRVDSGDVIGFVKRVNPDKAMGAGALADAIVDHFRLED
jgi:hypothetical protein